MLRWLPYSWIVIFHSTGEAIQEAVDEKMSWSDIKGCEGTRLVEMIDDATSRSKISSTRLNPNLCELTSLRKTIAVEAGTTIRAQGKL